MPERDNWLARQKIANRQVPSCWCRAEAINSFFSANSKRGKMAIAGLRETMFESKFSRNGPRYQSANDYA
jgi:hypothetical protein